VHVHEQPILLSDLLIAHSASILSAGRKVYAEEGVVNVETPLRLIELHDFHHPSRGRPANSDIADFHLPGCFRFARLSPDGPSHHRISGPPERDTLV
jgi:hypothetical protein